MWHAGNRCPKCGGQDVCVCLSMCAAEFPSDLRHSGYKKVRFSRMSPEKTVEYLGRYTHRVAISNDRIVGCKKVE